MESAYLTTQSVKPGKSGPRCPALRAQRNSEKQSHLCPPRRTNRHESCNHRRGAAGLAAAHELVKHDHQPVVYERAPSSVATPPPSTWTAHAWREGTTTVHQRHRYIGARGRDRTRPSRARGRVQGGTLYDGKIYNFVTPLDLLKFKPLGLIDRLRLGLVTLHLQRKRDWGPLESVTAAECSRSTAENGPSRSSGGPCCEASSARTTTTGVGMAWLWARSRPGYDRGAKTC